MLALALSLALADVPVADPPRPYAIDWSRRRREATLVAQVGLGLAGAGVVLGGVVASQDTLSEPLLLASGYAVVGGLAMGLGGSMRARRALRGEGLEVSGLAGTLGWAGGALALLGPLAFPERPGLGVGIGAVGLLGAAIGAGAQLSVNAAGARRLELAVGPARVDGAVGIGLAARW